ncbi:MAG: ATP-binding protein, partial [Anaerolineaceae bacterium]
IITKSGKVRWVQNTVRPVWDDQQGRVIELIGAVRDITERKQAEDKIRESEARYRSLFEDSPISLWEEDYSAVKHRLDALRKQGVKDIHAYLKAHPQVVREIASQVRVMDVNKASLNLYHARKKEELTQNPTGVFCDESYDSFREELVNVAAGKIHFEWESVDQTLDGRRLYVNQSWSIAPGHESDLSKVNVSIVDITKRKQVEELLKHHTEELEALSLVSTAMRNAQSRSEICPVILSQVYYVFNGSAAALGTYDPSSDEINIELAIGGWENLTGKRQSVTVGITGKVYSENQPYILNNLIDEEHFEWSTETSNIPCAACVPLTTNERTIGVLWLGRQTPITDQDLQLLTAIADMAASALQRQALHEDLQAKLIALQEAQAQIIQGEKLAAIGQLTSGIAHELNNPLTSVILYAQMLQRKSASDSVKRDLDKMVKETLRASRIVRGLLDFARQRPPETTSVNINDLIKKTVDFIAYEIRSNKIQITLDLFPGIPVIMADPHQLQQVFINLMNNASQAMSEIHDGGNLWINTEVGLSGYKVKSGDKTPVIRISFRDDGPGVQAENLAKIFDPFFTTKPEGSGTGLGLSICHGIITEHGGNIWVESEEGHGATFFIELPVNLPGRNEITKVEDSSGSKSPENSHILIIDDERNIQEVLKRALKGKGYLVDAVSSADEGLDKIVKVNYSTILCDIRMPGINGFDFYSEVAARNPKLAKRIVLITGGVVDSKIQDLIHDKNILCLTKPFDLDELIMMIKIIENDKANKKEMRIRPPHAQKPSKK